MKWILKMNRIGAHASAVSVGPSGELHPLPIAEVRGADLVPSGPLVRRVFEGKWEDWKIGDAQHFLDVLEIPEEFASSNRHTVFQASVNRQTWHIPAVAVLKAMCGRAPNVLSRIFVPSGMEDLAITDYRSWPPRVVIIENTRFAANLSETSRSFLHWLTGSSSATLAFNSALSNALKGDLTFPLPKGSVKFSARGVEVKGNFYVGSIEIAEVSVQPSDSLDGTAVHHILSPRAAKGELVLPYSDFGLSRTTDWEWQEVWPIVKDAEEGEEHEEFTRQLLDQTLAKYVYGYKWRDLELDPRPLLEKWKRLGLWDQVLEVLAVTRDGNERYAPHVMTVQTSFMFSWARPTYTLQDDVVYDDCGRKHQPAV